MDGAYCKYCDRRCFVYRVIPDGPKKGGQGILPPASEAWRTTASRQGTNMSANNPLKHSD